MSHVVAILWLFSGHSGVLMVWLDQCSYSTSGPVSTGMGNCLSAGKPSRYLGLASHVPRSRLTQPSTLSWLISLRVGDHSSYEPGELSQQHYNKHCHWYVVLTGHSFSVAVLSRTRTGRWTTSSTRTELSQSLAALKTTLSRHVPDTCSRLKLLTQTSPTSTTR